MIKKYLNRKYLPEFLIFFFALFTRFFRLDVPKNYIFDEVYHAWTAGQMFMGNPAAWEWWNTPPAGVAYEWTHPPLAKEFMVLAIAAFGNNSFAWRFFSALFGFGVIVLIYLIAYKLFKSRTIALFASFAASCDGLLLVMSRIGMNDMYFLFFAMLAFLFFLNKKNFLMAVSLGLSVASKWTGLFAVGILGIIFLAELSLLLKRKKIKQKEALKKIIISPIYFILIPFIIYLLVYLPFFTGHHTPPGEQPSPFNVNTFIGLQEQMYWYHTDLKATHPYQSVPVQWVFDLRPVWIYVNYSGSTIANIYNLGNPLFMWFGLAAMIFLLFDYIKERNLNQGIVIFSYLAFFVPWAASPRIMFYYHYLPAVPFLAIATGYVLNKLFASSSGRIVVAVYLFTLVALFIYFLPLWTAIPVPKCQIPGPNCTSWYDSFFWLPSWK